VITRFFFCVKQRRVNLRKIPKSNKAELLYIARQYRLTLIWIDTLKMLAFNPGGNNERAQEYEDWNQAGVSVRSAFNADVLARWNSTEQHQFADCVHQGGGRSPK
jgi:hypothetical protein